MSESPQRMWSLLMAGSDELAAELGLESPPEVFAPERALAAIDDWLAAHGASLDEEDAARLGFFLARVLIEAHGGGLAQIRKAGHALDGEWAITGFTSGLAADYHVPFLISAVRLGVDRSLRARDWYAQLRAEGGAGGR
jgi:hypothetical protein